MKNLKNMISAVSLMAVMVFGAISANAGLLISDRNTGCQNTNTAQELPNAFDGIIIIGAPIFEGIIIIGRAGLLISDRGNGCQEKSGLLISDRGGLIVSD